MTLGLTSQRPLAYSKDEIDFIKQNVGKLTLTEIGEKLGRSQSGLSKFVAKTKIASIRKRKKSYSDNIDKGVVPFFSKGANYREIIENMKTGDSFQFPYADRHIVAQQKYSFINELKKNGKKTPSFIIRKTDITDEVQMCRMWRLM